MPSPACRIYTAFTTAHFPITADTQRAQPEQAALFVTERLLLIL